MDRLVIASTRRSAGKTSVVVGLARALGKKYGYIKPLGDRLVYRKKRSWDYDAGLLTYVLDAKDNPEDVTIGFEHSKLRYMYSDETIKSRLEDMVSKASTGRDMLFIEGGRDLQYGVSVYLDAITLAKNLKAKLLLVASGNEDAIVDDITFVKKSVDMAGVDFRGVIVNKVHDLEDFNATYLKSITDLGVKVLGVIPYESDLTGFTMDYLSEYLFAKVISGERGLSNFVRNIFVGAMSTNEAMRNPLFNRENKLIVTTGDRGDMIITALETKTSGVLLTNNLLPPSNIIAKSSEMNIPLLLVSDDIYNVARQIDAMEPLLTRDNTANINLLAELIKKNVKLKDI
ncbi:MAG: AAA family ATPase [Spirochaetes bacterium]|jgi:BioD-like phosphotransacetylase family protein|nr:AAA family ATPase [Spirochaetota bacterium]